MDFKSDIFEETLANNEAFDADVDDLSGKNIPIFLIQNQDNTAEQQEMLDGQDQNIRPKQQSQDETNFKIDENIILLNRKICENDIQMIEKSFKSHFVFFNLSKQLIDFLIQKLGCCTQKKDQFIFQQGDQATSYFIIQKGQAEVIINEKQVKVISEGDHFGEIALLYNTTRSASIRTITDCNFWILDSINFKKAVQYMMITEYEENRNFINEIPFFSFMTPQQKVSIAHSLISTKFEPEESIVNEGDQADSFFIIKSGTLGVYKGNKQINTMGPQDCFGEQALYQKSQRGASVKAITKVKCLSLGRDNLTNILGDKIQFIIFKNIMRWTIGKSDILNQLMKLHQEKITLQAQIQNYNKGSVIFKKDTKCEQLVIILEGSLQSDDDKIEKGNCFGDQFLLQKKKDDLLQSDYIMVSDGILAIISFEQMFTILGGDFETAIQEKFDQHEIKYQNPPTKARNSHIQIDDLIFIKKVFSFQFEVLYLVKHKDQNNYYILKCINKAKILQGKLQKQLLQEKRVLEICNSPFISEFSRTFKDEISIYFLSKYIKGMDLFDVIREIGLLDKEQTQYYVGTIILCLEYLHSNGIVHRDVVPGNFIVNTEGKLFVSDMESAKQISQSQGQRTFTLIGTPHYMAPEIITGKGYSYNVDFWSLGVCFYEFQCGGVPYAEDLDNPFEIYENILNNELRFPNFFKDQQAKICIQQLLSKQPEARLGTSFADLKSHAWFEDFDWDKLQNQQLTPPYIPPKKRMISDSEIEKQIQQGKFILQEIEEHQQQNYMQQNQEQVIDLNWDQSF